MAAASFIPFRPRCIPKPAAAKGNAAGAGLRIEELHCPGGCQETDEVGEQGGGEGIAGFADSGGAEVDERV